MPRKLTNIDRERKLKGLTLKELSSLIGVSVTTIQAWKKKMFYPSAHTAKIMRDNKFSDKTCNDPGGISEE